MTGAQANTGAEPVTPADPPIDARLVADLVEVDLTTGRSFVDAVPHAAFDVLRAAGGVAWHAEPPPDPAFNEQGDMLRFVESPGFWVVTRHDLVTEVLRNQGQFSSAARWHAPCPRSPRRAWPCSGR